MRQTRVNTFAFYVKLWFSFVLLGISFWDKFKIGFFLLFRKLSQVCVKFFFPVHAKDNTLGAFAFWGAQIKLLNATIACRAWHPEDLMTAYYSLVLIPKMLDMLGVEKLLDPNAVFLDIGAHVGFWSLVVSKNYNCKSYAFEPNPETFKHLQNHIKMNNLEDKIIPVQKALWKEETTLLFYLSRDSGSCSVILKKEMGCLSIEVDTLDHFLFSQGISPKNVCLVKIDVEGAEREVLMGGKQLLKEGKPAIFFEAWNSTYLQGIREVLNSYNYNEPVQIDRLDYFVSPSESR